MIRGKQKKNLIIPPPDQCFWVNNGPIVSDLQDLHYALTNEVTPEQFQHHVNESRNDFADWIEYTLHDKACAKLVRGVKKQTTAASKIKQCLKGYVVG